MNYFEMDPEIKNLLIKQSSEKSNLLYNSNPYPYQIPKIGPRPPYYRKPRYVLYYPII
ncbi:hypothetical protein [Peribacillus deserti]|uniref:hypothetical protein n=1 Tax=Peribacillus deserti TaxID=673318 RepID=UPI0015E10222|nr:hypothetical protein [Peribacillus deserti]